MNKKQTKQTSDALIDKAKLYSVEEIAAFLPQVSTSKFAGSIDVDIVLAFSEKQKKEVVSGSVTLPHQVGKSVRIAVVTQDSENQNVAKKAGADLVGAADLAKTIEGGVLDFDVLIATPDAMPLLARLGKVLGPRGLMPSPKNETVTTDLEKTVKSYKAGKLNFKSTDQLAIRARVGKVDMEPVQIAENITTFVTAVYSEAKKVTPQPLKKVTISPTMGNGMRLDLSGIIVS